MDVAVIYGCISIVLIMFAFFAAIFMKPELMMFFLVAGVSIGLLPPPSFIANQVPTLQERDVGKFVSYTQKQGSFASGGVITTTTDVITINSTGVSIKVGDSLSIKKDRSGRWPQSKLCNASDRVCYEIAS